MLQTPSLPLYETLREELSADHNHMANCHINDSNFGRATLKCSTNGARRDASQVCAVAQ